MSPWLVSPWWLLVIAFACFYAGLLFGCLLAFAGRDAAREEGLAEGLRDVAARREARPLERRRRPC